MKIATLGVVAALIAGPAFAQAKPAMSPAAKPTATAHVAATSTTTHTTTSGGSTHMATHTTKTGKTMKYDCSKAGNKNKKVCKAK